MTPKSLTRAVLLATTISMAATTLPVSYAAAQGYNQPPPDYNGGPPPDYNNNGPPPDYNNGGPPPDYNGNNGPPPDYNNGGPPPNGNNYGPPPDYQGGPNSSDYADQPPPGYNGAAPPPPPPGYDASAVTPDQQRQDQRYEAYAEDWAQQNCVKAHGDPAAGAVIGGLFGALIGAGVGGRHGAFAGAVIGGTSGAVIAGSSGGNATSPGCPPGYVVRGGAPGFYYDTDIAYAAPYWYHPWFWGGDRWMFRPYPYHTFYYQHYWRGGHGPYHHWR